VPIARNMVSNEAEDITICRDQPNVDPVRANANLFLETWEYAQQAKSELQDQQNQDGSSDAAKASKVLFQNLDCQLKELSPDVLEKAVANSIIDQSEADKINQCRVQLEREAELQQMRSRQDHDDLERE